LIVTWQQRAAEARARSLSESSEAERNVQIGLAAAWTAAAAELKAAELQAEAKGLKFAEAASPEPVPEQALADAKANAAHGWSEADHQRAHKEEYIQMLLEAEAKLQRADAERIALRAQIEQAQKYLDDDRHDYPRCRKLLADLIAALQGSPQPSGEPK